MTGTHEQTSPTTKASTNSRADEMSLTKPKRRKTARACKHCHKAHMTCDEGRPCKRCIMRGFQDTCVDAPRKRKKYLIDVPENLDSSQASFASSTNTPIDAQSVEIKQETPLIFSTTPALNDRYPPPIPTKESHFQHSLGFQEINRSNTTVNAHAPVPKPASKFMSSAANNEYSILSDIIKQDYQFYNSNPGIMSESTVSPPNNNHTTSDTMNSVHRLRHHSTNSGVSRNSTPTPNSEAASLSQHDIYNAHKQADKTINQYKLGMISDQIITYPDVMKVIDGENAISSPIHASHKLLTSVSNPTLSFSIAINEAVENQTLENPRGLRFKEPEDIYAKIDKPFSYTPGFHSLIQYLRQRFNATDLIKMAKSMASYRPSFIACTNTLKEEDLIFMEQCFQRTLLEYDKFISISGTPTIVWRRTGQISYVSEEFSILTGWSRDDLINKMTFIVELMDDDSVIEYFDLFSTIAYGDFKAATMGSCTLLTPYNSRIKTTCIWTLKRDVFGIPMMIIGNFLPIL